MHRGIRPPLASHNRSMRPFDMTWHRIAFSGLLLSAIAGAQTLNCDFQGYQALDGLKAAMRSGSLELTWQGERGQTLRATLGVDGGQPVVRELAVAKNGKWSVLGHRSEEHTSELQSPMYTLFPTRRSSDLGERGQTLRATLGVDGGQPVVRELAVAKNGKWSVLGHDLTPEYQVATGRRRISAQQEVPLRQLGMYTPEIIERQKWFAFWDAPLNVPGRSFSNAAVDLPLKPEDTQRAWAAFQVTGCQ